MSIRYVRSTEQRADCLAEGAFTTIQKKTVMRMLDIHPPLQLNADTSLSESSFSAVSQRDFESERRHLEQESAAPDAF